MGRKIKDNKVNTDKLKGPMISSKLLLLVSLIYIGLPIILFLVNWFDWYIGIPAAALLLFALYGFWKGFEDDSFYVSLIDLLAASVICFIFLIFCGQGGLFLQSWDNHTKNAIFRDLIELDWPVVYEETGNVLVYYFMYWLVPALAGKLGGWELANRFLLCFTTLGVMLAMLWTLRSVGGGKRRRPYLTMIALVFLFWSGMNYIGNIFSVRFGLTDYSLIFSSNEGWLDGQINGYDSSYLYRSIYDSLQQSYNYAIPAWLVTSMLLNLKDIRYFALLGCLCLPYAPIPFVGMLPLFLAKAFPELFESIKKHETGKFFLRCFSKENIIAIATIIIPFYFFFSLNLSSGMSLYIPWEAWDKKRLLAIALFYIFEFGILALALIPVYKKDIVFWASVIILLICPLIKIGTGRDFCMNASFPAIFTLFALTVKYWIQLRKKLLTTILTIAVFLLGTLTAIGGINENYFIFSWYYPYISPYADNTYTLRDKELGDDCPDTYLPNYLCPLENIPEFYRDIFSF